MREDQTDIFTELADTTPEKLLYVCRSEGQRRNGKIDMGSKNRTQRSRANGYAVRHCFGKDPAPKAPKLGW